MIKLNIIIPCHNEENNIDKLFRAISDVLINVTSLSQYHIIFIDDGSTDHTLQCIKGLCRKTETVSFVSFTRNFGKEAALYAGIQEALKYGGGGLYCLYGCRFSRSPCSFTRNDRNFKL